MSEEILKCCIDCCRYRNYAIVLKRTVYFAELQSQYRDVVCETPCQAERVQNLSNGPEPFTTPQQNATHHATTMASLAVNKHPYQRAACSTLALPMQCSCLKGLQNAGQHRLTTLSVLRAPAPRSVGSLRGRMLARQAYRRQRSNCAPKESATAVAQWQGQLSNALSAWGGRQKLALCSKQALSTT